MAGGRQKIAKNIIFKRCALLKYPFGVDLGCGSSPDPLPLLKGCPGEAGYLGAALASSGWAGKRWGLTGRERKT